MKQTSPYVISHSYYISFRLRLLCFLALSTNVIRFSTVVTNYIFTHAFVCTVPIFPHLKHSVSPPLCSFPLVGIACPRKFTSRNQNSHIDILADNFFSCKFCNTNHRCSTRSSSHIEYTKISSIKMKNDYQQYSHTCRIQGDYNGYNLV